MACWGLVGFSPAVAEVYRTTGLQGCLCCISSRQTAAGAATTAPAHIADVEGVAAGVVKAAGFWGGQQAQEHNAARQDECCGIL